MISYKMSEVIQVLTIFAAFFIPLTFVAVVYDMNFDFMPELHFKFMYPMVWIFMIGTAITMIFTSSAKNGFRVKGSTFGISGCGLRIIGYGVLLVASDTAGCKKPEQYVSNIA